MKKHNLIKDEVERLKKGIKENSEESWIVFDSAEVFEALRNAVHVVQS